jgi:hypothetical protein
MAPLTNVLCYGIQRPRTGCYSVLFAYYLFNVLPVSYQVVRLSILISVVADSSSVTLFYFTHLIFLKQTKNRRGTRDSSRCSLHGILVNGLSILILVVAGSSSVTLFYFTH